MKKKHLKTRLLLNKQTISKLSSRDASRIMGGENPPTDRDSICDCDMDESVVGGDCEGSFMLICETIGCPQHSWWGNPTCHQNCG